ncbi:MmoB/DmpM family protein [Candidatus Thiothrix sp. Deng01]|uniref:MmoB/DmpM family protein n=1 Tax=Candidatus Thiothrix phosphatis TaxID=3112415 RepID=A0ABU6CTN1_9GAMM|nr:MmoB/DmpM family protein [Candidatus Thiothrix sp. Deng01]MEB4590190.1 MmoB/DmpM family protein [Candidatus Thiothrix sp. Deng01]
MSDSKVFVIFQNTAEAQPFISAFEQENPQATLDYQPGMVRIEGLGELGITRDVVAEQAGRDVDLQEMHLTLVSLSGNIDEDDDYFRISRH